MKLTRLPFSAGLSELSVLFVCQCAENTKFLVRACFLEIYNEDIRDLLGNDTKQRLEVKFVFFFFYMKVVHHKNRGTVGNASGRVFIPLLFFPGWMTDKS